MNFLLPTLRPQLALHYCGSSSINCFLLTKFLTNQAAKEFDADAHLSALRNDDVGVTLRRLDKLEMHRADGSFVLLERSLKCSAAFINISTQPSHQPYVIRRIDEYPNVEQIKNARLGKDQDPFDDHDRPRLD